MRKYKVFQRGKQITEFESFKDLRKGDDLVLPTIYPEEGVEAPTTVYPIYAIAYEPHSDTTNISIG